MKNYTIKNIKEISSIKLKERQIRNKVREIKPLFPNLIIGGDRRRNNTYYIHYSLIKKITKSKIENENELFERCYSINKHFKETIKKDYFETNWLIRVHISPENDILLEDIHTLLYKIKSKIFYSIHYNIDNQRKHLHLTLTDDIGINVFEKIFNELDCSTNIKSENFLNELREDSFNYYMFENKYSNKENQRVYDYGIIENI